MRLTLVEPGGERGQLVGEGGDEELGQGHERGLASVGPGKKAVRTRRREEGREGA
jgi:hypothetical protein